MEAKMNYQKELEKLLIRLKETGQTPSLLLHACCAPCSSYTLLYLAEYFRITVYYYNPNIEPAQEYRRRAEELKKLLERLPLSNPVSYLEGAYDPERFEAAAKGLEDEHEGGKRCLSCYELRLSEAARAAAEGGFDYFTTTLSISPYKNAQKLNEIGALYETQRGLRYLHSDFKKNGGYQRSIELSKEYNLYRQDYCGCRFSREQAEKRRGTAN